MKRVHILVHNATFLDNQIEYTTILGAYSSAEKVNRAYKEVIEDYKAKKTFVRGYEELSGCYRLECKKSIHYFNIEVKELQ